MAAQDEVHPGRWFSTNLVGVPAPVLASPAFNEHPVPLQIAGARATQRGLFALLAHCSTLTEASAVFEHLVSITFGLQRAAPGAAGAEARRWRTSYIKLLQGWGLDAGGPAAAVLKGWVESRFGLVPTYHRAPLGHFPSDAWLNYLMEKAQGRWHNNAIWRQLDLLFEFCQWSLARFAPLGAGRWVELWRGASPQEARAGRDGTVRLNNIVSMSLSRDAASCFGDWVLRLRVPQCKLVCYPGLLDTHVLDGEGEVLVLGGDYRAVVRYD
ncbi:NAD(+)--dinitrogen-reductase ADP-D-ribosyltransferase [Pelomonas cellulosilytica]|uniref:NAD(+)--dinitrogen-reductase ADP-D-ribosyltransferase n=1 Tax=Pelomonas cellulosilytica TaxID=2906762 RepID=A0ABS8Y199_9BURK|nr:NAD(+)--dinitrogen-reductase ADP-D-ribosyltransferase [Pelomonas sp. P8]MCE4556801.1 NAD(+)--dinitrogen-reductase ADP-D-ribosyltransferase [Pelomonas sp. P8]